MPLEKVKGFHAHGRDIRVHSLCLMYPAGTIAGASSLLLHIPARPEAQLPHDSSFRNNKDEQAELMHQHPFTLRFTILEMGNR